MRSRDEQTLCERLRRDAGLTQKQLAQSAMTALSTLHLAETLKAIPGDDILARWASQLGCRAADLRADFTQRLDRITSTKRGSHAE